MPCLAHIMKLKGVITMVTKKEFVDRLTKKGYTKKAASVALDDVFRVIVEALADGESVQVRGVGTFGVRERSAREVFSPIAGKTVSTPSHKVPYFASSSTLKTAVREGRVRE